MATIMGIDPDLTNTGWVVLDDKEIFHGAIPTVPKDFESDIQRVIYISSKLNEVILYHKPQVVYLEGFSFGSRGRSLYQLGMLGGLIRKILWEMSQFGELKYKEIPPKVIKHFCSGKGNAAKEDMKLHVYKKWKIEFPSNDEVDAFVLAKLAEKELEGK